MAGHSKPTSTWSFTEFVHDQSLHFTHLKPLAEFLTGKHSEPRWSFPWSRSTDVNVLVIDIGKSDRCPNPGLLRPRLIRDLGELQQATLNIPHHLVVRLFLVEDMVASVVDVLGTAFRCQPDFFYHHMLYRGVIWQEAVAEAGNNDGKRGSPIIDNSTLTSIRRREHFSLPFQRYGEEPDDITRLQKQRTMFRNQKDLFLEERVTGAIFQGINGERAGVLLFDSSLDELFGDSDYSIFEEVPRYNPQKLSVSRNQINPSTATRDLFLRGLNDVVFDDNTEYLETTILRPLFGIIRHKWCQIIASESYHIADDSVDLQWVDDWHLEMLKSTQAVLADNLTMLQECLVVLNQGGTKRICQPQEHGWDRKLREEFGEDFQDLISRTMECTVKNERSQGFINTLTMIQDTRNGLKLTQQALQESKRSIELSKKAINQAENIQALTTLATFYIPLSFACSFFGMNVSQLTGQSPVSLWIFFVVAIPLTLVSLVMVYHWVKAVQVLRQVLQFMKTLIHKASFVSSRGKHGSEIEDEEQNRDLQGS